MKLILPVENGEDESPLFVCGRPELFHELPGALPGGVQRQVEGSPVGRDLSLVLQGGGLVLKDRRLNQIRPGNMLNMGFAKIFAK